MSSTHTPDTDPVSSSSSPEDVAATFCATLVDEWIQLGVRHAVIAPGSRSTPLAIALTARTELTVEVFHDERSASFAALGIGLSTGIPAVLLCTSGTASAHFHAAVIEAHLSAVPMLVCTADRPPELRDVGAAQTIDQTKLYGDVVRWFHDPGVAASAAADTWRSTAAHALASTIGVWPGPVHLNLSFREPLIGSPARLPPRRHRGRASLGAAPAPDLADLCELGELVAGRSGVIVAGRGCGDPFAVAELAAALGWPVLADVRSGLRTGVAAHTRVSVTAFDDILRSTHFTAAHRPTVVLRLGEPPASKVLGQWLSRLDAVQVHVSALPTWTDPDGHIDRHLTADVTAVCTALADTALADTGSAAPAAWLEAWLAAEETAQRAIDMALASAATGSIAGSRSELVEPAVARTLGRSVPAGSNLVVSSSMPIRDVEWYANCVGDATVFANRGANGIDGVVATAAGIALGTGTPTFLLIGDVALLHDSSSLTALVGRPIDLRIVLVDNDGGGIFSFLPQAESLAADRFETLFGTPHGVDLAALAAAHALPVAEPTTVAELVAALGEVGTRLVLIRSDRARNVAVHDEIHRFVAEALASTCPHVACSG